MSVQMNWPVRWNPNTERLLCERLGAALRGLQMDPTLIRGQFDVKDLRLGTASPHIEFLGISKASTEQVGLDVFFSYCDTVEQGFSISIGGAEISLTGMEADDTSFAPTKLWCPFEVTLYNIQVSTKVTVEYGVKRAPRQRHAPPPPHAIHELQFGRQRGVPARPLRADASSGLADHYTTPNFSLNPSMRDKPLMALRPQTSGDCPRMPSESQGLSLRRRSGDGAGMANSSEGDVGRKRDAGGGSLWSHGPKARAPHHIGFAYAARRVHYPRWGARGNAAAGAGGVMDVPSAPPTPQVHPSTSSFSTMHQPAMLTSGGIRNVPSLTSLDGHSMSFASHMSSPSNSTTRGRSATLHSFPGGGDAPPPPPHLLTPSDTPTLHITFSSVPDVDFSLHTNFRTLKGADEQVTNIMKSVLKPELAALLRGITVRLGEGVVELGPERQTSPAASAQVSD